MGTRTWLVTWAAVAIAACGGNVRVGDEPGPGAGGTAGGGAGGTLGGGTGGKSSGGTGGIPVGCPPGTVTGCLCPGGFKGEQVCQPDGTFGPCACAGGGGAAGVGGTGTGGCSPASCFRNPSLLSGDCLSCACGACTQPTCDCQADPGCSAIVRSSQSMGCRGVTCYQDSTCKAVIDGNGGPTGIAASVALTLSSCLESAGCPCVSMGTCRPTFCPSNGLGAPCCITPEGPCGMQTPAGCQMPCKCDGDHTLYCQDGSTGHCLPFRCSPGGYCLQRCATNQDCVTGYACTNGVCR